MACTWRSTARGLRDSCAAIARFDRPSAISPQHLALAVGQLVEQSAAAAADEARDHGRVEGRAARRHALDGVDELGDVAHAVLEQVADAGGVVADQLEHVGRLEVLREDEDRDRRMRAPDLGGGHQSIVGVARRHADVDDGDVGHVGAHLEHEVVGVVRAADHLVPGVPQQRRDALAQQRIVVGDHHAQGRRRGGRRTVSGCNVAGGHGSV